MNEHNNKPKYQGNWTCSNCNTAITELPFEPRNTDGLKCIDCLKKTDRPQRQSGQKVQGSWPCSMCDATITELPFEPRSTDGLKCVDCFKKNKGL